MFRAKLFSCLVLFALLMIPLVHAKSRRPVEVSSHCLSLWLELCLLVKFLVHQFTGLASDCEGFRDQAEEERVLCRHREVCGIALSFIGFVQIKFLPCFLLHINYVLVFFFNCSSCQIFDFRFWSFYQASDLVFSFLVEVCQCYPSFYFTEIGFWNLIRGLEIWEIVVERDELLYEKGTSKF